MLEIHEFSSHATVHTTATQYIPTGGIKMKNEKKGVQGGFKNWSIPSDRHTSFQKAFQSVEERICLRKVPSNCTTQSRCLIHNKPPLIITPLVTTFFVTLTNCDLNVYNHIPYKHFQGCDYRQRKKTLENNPFMLK